jgi:propanol-preferring alcohol dehydrogenase
MRCLLLRRPGPIETSPLEEAESPDPKPGQQEIVIAIQACGVCHTDLHEVEGELALARLPVIPGHQIVGAVSAMGPHASRFRPGDRVGVPWLNWVCGECDYCRRGSENLCERARFTGLHTHGGYAQYIVIHEDFAYHLPAGLDAEHTAPLLCAGVIGYRALRLSKARPGGRLGLYGFGASAHLVLQIAAHQGCHVYVFSRSAGHRKLAESLGARWTGRAEDSPGVPLDSAIIFAPAGPLVPLALAALGRGGTCALAGIYMSPIPELDYSQSLYHERSLISVANSTRRDVEGLLELAPLIPLRTEVETFPLAQANQALQHLKHGEVRGAAVLEIG